MSAKSKIKSLTGVKGLAIYIIVMYHTLIVDPAKSNPIPLFIANYGGYLGDFLFFMLSGFLISYNYKEKIQHQKTDLKDFFTKRLRKLYPLYFITNIISMLDILYTRGIRAFNLKEFILVMSLQTGGALENIYPYNHPTWFICTLMFCYLVYFILAHNVKNDSYYHACLIAGILWGYVLLTRNLNFPFCYEHNGEAFINFFLGCILAEIYNQISNVQKKHLLWGSLCIFSMLITLSCLVGFHHISSDIRFAFSFIICPVIVIWALFNPICLRILNIKPLVFLGNISTSVYFWHMIIYNIVIMWMDTHSISMTKAWYLFYLALLTLASIFSYNLLERKLFTNFLSPKTNDHIPTAL